MPTAKRKILRRALSNARAATAVADRHHEVIASMIGPWVVCEVCDTPVNEQQGRGPSDAPLCLDCQEIKP